MRKRTITKQLQNAIRNNLLLFQRAEIYNKTTRETETVPNDKFLECFDFFCESGFFMDSIGWHYERNHETGNYEIDCGRMNPDSEVVVIAHLRACDSVNKEDIDKALMIIED